MKPKRRRNLFLLGLFLAVWLQLTSVPVASAHNCIETFQGLLNPNVPPQGIVEDCLRTGYSQAILTALVAAFAGGAIARQVGQALSEASEEQNRRDPCRGERERFGLASANVQALFHARLQFQGLLNALETQYLNTSRLSYISGTIDIGFLAGSIFSKPLQGALGIKVKQALAEKALKAAIKGFGKELIKDVAKGLSDQAITWEDLIKKPAKDAAKKAVLESVKEGLVSRTMQGFLEQGLRAGEFRGAAVTLAGRAQAYDLIRKSVTDNYVAPYVDFFGNMLSIWSMSDGILSGMKKLEAIRASMREIRDHLSKLNLAFDSAMDELGLARHAYDYCQSLHPEVEKRP